MSGTERRDCSLERLERRPRLIVGFVWALALLVSAAARWGGAWAGARITDPDGGIVALMARHMAEGVRFPVFFYGQAYMGTLEPALSALLYRWLEPTGFAVNLGTALFGFAAVVALLLWARDIAGLPGVWIAAGLCAIGPAGFASFMVVPRGGYAAATYLQTVFLAETARLCARLGSPGSPPPAWRALAAGLAAGLAWWSHPIVTSALLAGGAACLVHLRKPRALHTGTVMLLGFLIGSAPFWVWNAVHGWESLQMLRGVGAVSLSVGLKSFPLRLIRFVNGTLTLTPMGRVQTAVFGALLLIGLWGLVRRTCAEKTLSNLAVLSGWLAALHLGIFLVLYLCSPYITMNTGRYLVPVFPSLAVLAASGADRRSSGRRFRTTALVALATVVLLSQTVYFRQLQADRRKNLAVRTVDREMAALLERESAEAVYAHFHHHAFNFALGERWVFTEGRGERVPGYAERAESANRVAFVDNRFDVEGFLQVCGGQGTTTRLEGLRVTHGLHPPEEALSEIPVSDWGSVTDERGGDLSLRVADRDVDTEWSVWLSDGTEVALQLDFARPERPRMLRLHTPAGDWVDCEALVEYLDPQGGRWTAVCDWHRVPQLFWSGPRPYWWGPAFRIEYRLPGLPARALRWRVRRVPGTRRVVRGRIVEVQVFRSAGGGEPAEVERIEVLQQIVEQKGWRRVYADRWLSNRLRPRSVLRPVEAGVVPTDPFMCPIVWDIGTAVITRSHDAPLTRQTFRSAGLPFEEIVLPPWCIFAATEARSRPPVAWAGFAMLHSEWNVLGPETVKRQLARLDSEEGLGEAMAWLLHLYRRAPERLAAVDELVRALEERHPGLLQRLAPEVWAEWNRLAVPEVRLEAEFEHGLRLVGLRIEPQRVRAGQPVSVTYYWSCPAEHPVHSDVVFVHFETGSVRFQDDHALPSPRGAGRAPTGALLRETRTVTVPSHVPPGPVTLAIGVYDPATHRRSRVRSALNLPVRRRAVRYSPVLYVVAP